MQIRVKDKGRFTSPQSSHKKVSNSFCRLHTATLEPTKHVTHLHWLDQQKSMDRHMDGCWEWVPRDMAPPPPPAGSALRPNVYRESAGMSYSFSFLSNAYMYAVSALGIYRAAINKWWSNYSSPNIQILNYSSPKYDELMWKVKP